MLDNEESTVTDNTIFGKFYNLMKHAKKRNKDFTITIQHFTKLFEENNGQCSYTGEYFSDIPNSEMYPSIDRINPSYGYIPGNIVICTRFSNNIKERYFESGDIQFVKNEHLEISTKIYDKIKNCTELRKLSLLEDEEVPKISNGNILENYLRKVRKSKVMGIKVPELEDLNVYKHNISIPIKSTKTEPSDYKYCQQYIKFCENNKNVKLTYNEFKTKITQDVCDFSNNVIENRSLFIMDSTKYVTADNILVVNEEYLKILHAMKESKISFSQMKMFVNNVCNNINININKE